MTIYIIYHNVRSVNVPQCNYIPDSTVLPDQSTDDPQFDMHFVDDMPDADIAYSRIEDVPTHGNWFYVIRNYYDTSFYTRNNLKILDYFMSIPRFMDDLIAGYGRILFDDRREGYLFANYIQGQIEGFFRRHSIPLDRVVFATSAVNANDIFASRGYSMKPLILQQFELESSWLLYNSTPPPPSRNITRRFLCFNRTYHYRIHRLQLLAKMYRRNLLDQFYYSMLDGVDNTNVVKSAAQVTGVEPPSYDTVGAMRELKSRMPMLLDTDDLKTNLANVHTDSVVSYYNQTGISVVTETLFHDGEIFFSEKTWHPMRMQHPFILLNGPYALQYLRDAGYKTFNQWWDESYDTIQDPYERLDAIEQVIVDIAAWSQDKFFRVLNEIQSTCWHNLQHLTTAHLRIKHDARLAALFSAQ